MRRRQNLRPPGAPGSCVAARPFVGNPEGAVGRIGPGGGIVAPTAIRIVGRAGFDHPWAAKAAVAGIAVGVHHGRISRGRGPRPSHGNLAGHVDTDGWAEIPITAVAYGAVLDDGYTAARGPAIESKAMVAGNCRAGRSPGAAADPDIPAVIRGVEGANDRVQLAGRSG